MTETEAVARMRSLFEWWMAPENPLPVALADKFEFDSGLGTMSADDWLWWVRQNPGWGAVRVLGLVASSTGGSIVFGATDPVTNLRHRISWLVMWNEATLTRILQTGATVPEEAELD
jgi:hypothetical protein